VFEVPRNRLPRGVTVGAMLTGEDGHGRAVPLVVVGLDGDVARLDATHPLAGKDLAFSVKVVRVEQATDEEIEHGHVH
jgi:FKBP-type peptidyl-prolyl cis-trans isomerase SlyD